MPRLLPLSTFDVGRSIFKVLTLFLILSLPAQAAEMSEVWQRHYNNGQLLDPANPANHPDADPDGDGWTNLVESIAGTNPFDAMPPDGLVRTDITPHPDTNSVFILSWNSHEGKVYQLKVSSDLIDWAPIENPIPGTGQQITFAIDARHEDDTRPDKLFWRIQVADEDPDGDSLTSWDEIKLELNPHHPDTDLDGIPDNLDGQPLVSATLADPDGIGLPASIDTGLRGFWDFESTIGDFPNQFFPDRSGFNRHATASFFGPEPLGMPSKAARISNPFQPLTLPNSTVQGTSHYTVSGWFKLGKNSIQNSDHLHRAIFAVYQNFGTSQLGHPLGQGNGLLVRKNANGDEEWFVGGYKHTTYHNEPPNSNGNPKIESFGHTFILPAGTSDDDRWHHFVVTHSNTSFGQKVWIDGQLLVEEALKHYPIGINSDTTFSIGALFPTHTNSRIQDALIDRLRVHARVLTPAEALALHRQDIDQDGLWDITETKSRLWRDKNSDILITPDEIDFIANPFHWQFPETDTDKDGLTDIFEQNIGTRIDLADTDGDLIPDGFEVQHGLNPRDPSDAALDPDNDGLSNLREWQFNSNPNATDSDGDGTPDGIEANQGSHPGDAADGGQPLPPEQRLEILLGIGDQSGSESEDYILNVFRIDPETGAEEPFYVHRSGGFGEYAEETFGFFRKGDTYTFQLDWQGTNNQTKSSTPQSPGTEGPDFDYTFKVQPQGDHGGILIDSWHPSEGIDPTRPLLHEEANDVATTADEFTRNFENRRVVFGSLRLAVDADRDTALAFDDTDQTTSEAPYRFWVNGDNDASGGADADHTSPSRPDHSTSQIDGVRDLEDFTRMHLRLGGLHHVCGTNAKILLTLNSSSGSPKLKFVEATEPDGGLEYLLNPQTASSQVSQKSVGAVVNGTDLELPGKVLDRVNAQGVLPLIFEGSQAGQGQIRLIIKQDSQELATSPALHVKLMDVRRMFVQAYATPESGLPNPAAGTGPAPDYPERGFALNSQQPYDMPPDEAESVAVFVHGWKMPEIAARSFSETFFKRLWWAGYKGRFCSLRWPTLVDDFSFSHSELLAWKYGDSLKALVDSMPSGYKRSVMAHSLGNVLVAGAFRQGMSANVHIAMQAAIPEGCYDASAAVNSEPTFANIITPDSFAQEGGYRGYLTNHLPARLVNLYNPQDYALQTGRLHVLPVGTNWLAWQEKYKPREALSGDFGFQADGQYRYYPDQPKSTSSQFWKDRNDVYGGPEFIRNVTDEHEILAMVARPKSKALGASGISSIPIEQINLNGDPHFFSDTRDDHSAQFNRNIQQLTLFYTAITNEIK